METAADRVIPIALQEELATSFGRYAQYTILERAIPDIRDGLKPVQRRIVYAMLQSGNLPDRPYRKCAKTVGEVMGNYHPHGDQSIYDALTRLAQSWKMRLPVVDGHGNFGSVDDDPPAAMRYTEARLTAAATLLTQDIDEATVPFRPNFDESTEEPVVLPAMLPNLLINGTTGLSAGFQTEIPPHNLAEVTAALIMLVDRPAATLDEAMAHVPGPDFPGGGEIILGDGLREAYATGRGRIDLQSVVEVEAPAPPQRRAGGGASLVVKELPYGVIKSALVAQIEELKNVGRIQGVSDVRDESDREGMRVVVELERDAAPEKVLAYLFQKTDLRVAYNFNMVAIAGGAPKTVGLLDMLHAYLEHRREVVRRRSAHRRDKARVRLEEVEGLIRAFDILDEVIAEIRASRDRADAHRNIMARFGFTDVQATRIVDLRLHRLTTLSIVELREEEAALRRAIVELTELLESDAALARCIKKELRDATKAAADARRTKIVGPSALPEPPSVLEVMVPDQAIVVTLTRDGYLKRVGPRSEQEPEKLGARPGDVLGAWLESNTRHNLLLFSAAGQCYVIPGHAVPEARWAEPGVALPNLIPLAKDDRIVTVISRATLPEQEHLIFVTALGKVKRTACAELDTTRRTGILALKLDDGDRLVTVLDERQPIPPEILDAVRAELGIAAPAAGGAPGAQASLAAVAAGEGRFELLIVSRGGQAIRFAVEEISVQGRAAAGVRGMSLAADDAVAAALLVPRGDLTAGDADPLALAAHDPEVEVLAAVGAGTEVVLFTEPLRAKRTLLSEVPGQRRGGRGTRVIQQRKIAPEKVISVRLGWREWWASRQYVLVTSEARYPRITIALIRAASREGSAFSIAGLAAPGGQVGGRELLQAVLDDPRSPGPGAPPSGDPANDASDAGQARQKRMF
ncbi:MAG: DNA topoisomerase 4 subunit A [Candidatus Schekmanbacteria bacterium]|nr:DNA topoisomerase 4 subunit A [Candidatus Schekmanbacteria bacterium]